MSAPSVTAEQRDAAIEALHADQCQAPGCMARFDQTNAVDVVLAAIGIEVAR